MAIPLRFINVRGFINNTGTLESIPFECRYSPLPVLYDKPRVDMTRSTTRKPMLCRLREYRDSGFPKPTIQFIAPAVYDSCSDFFSTSFSSGFTSSSSTTTSSSAISAATATTFGTITFRMPVSLLVNILIFSYSRSQM